MVFVLPDLFHIALYSLVPSSVFKNKNYISNRVILELQKEREKE